MLRLLPTLRRATPLQRYFSSDLPYHLVVGMPALSPTMESGTLAEWYVDEKSSFRAGDALAKIETDKASIDFEAQDDGIVAKIIGTPNTEFQVGEPIMITVTEPEDVEAFENYVLPEVAPAAVAAPAATEPAVAEPVVVEPTPAPVENVVEAPVPVVATTPPTTIARPDQWGKSILQTSPIAHILLQQQKDYIETYGPTGFPVVQDQVTEESQ